MSVSIQNVIPEQDGIFFIIIRIEKKGKLVQNILQCLEINTHVYYKASFFSIGVLRKTGLGKIKVFALNINETIAARKDSVYWIFKKYIRV